MSHWKRLGRNHACLGSGSNICSAADTCQVLSKPCWIRYELWCVARAASTRYCMMHCAAPEQAARAWNAARAEQDAYSGTVFSDLWRRFEEPDSRNRWDQPLFRVATSEEPDSRAAVLQVCACCFQ